MTESTCTNCAKQDNFDGWYTVKNRFEKRVKKTRGCWKWSGHISPYGYGKFSINEREHWQAHRLSYFLYKGDIPRGMFVLHQCDNRSCVNPKHLRIGTQKENMADMYSRGRNYRMRSDEAYCAKLTWGQVREIRSLYRVGDSTQKLGNKYGVHRSQIFKIVNNKTWVENRV